MVQKDPQMPLEIFQYNLTRAVLPLLALGLSLTECLNNPGNCRSLIITASHSDKSPRRSWPEEGLCHGQEAGEL